MRLRPLLGPAFAVAITACGWWHWRTPTSLAFLLFAGALLSLAFLAPRLYAPIEHQLQRIGRLVAVVFTWLVLALVFLLIFLPGRLLLLLLRRDPLHRLPDPRRNSYWEPLPPSPGPGHFRRQF